MKRLLLTLSLLAASLAFAAGGDPVDSPSAVLKKFIEATKNLDCDTMVELSHGAQKKGFRKIVAKNELLKAAAEDGNLEARRMLDDIKAKMKDWRIDVKAEEIDGDLAVVYVVISGNPAGKSSDGPSGEFFRKVDGKWKYINGVDYLNDCIARHPAPRGASPSEIVEKYIAAFNSLDPLAAAELCHGEERADIIDTARAILQTKAGAYGGDEECRRKLETKLEKLKKWRAKVVDEKIDGDLAVVDVFLYDPPWGGKNGPDRQYLKKIGGEWKVVSHTDYEKEQAARKK